MLVTPATELLAMDGSCLPGPSDFDVRRPCLFPRRPTRGYFPFGESNQSHWHRARRRRAHFDTAILACDSEA